MKHAVKSVVALALVAIFSQAALGSDPVVIAFSGIGEGNGPEGLWVMDQYGGNKTLVYHPCPGSLGRAHWSPEGDSLVFVSQALYRVNVNSPKACGEAELIAESYGSFYLTLDSASYL